MSHTDEMRDTVIEAVNKDLGECKHVPDGATCDDCLRRFFKKYVPPYLRLLNATIFTYGFLESVARDSQALHRLRRALRLHGFDPRVAKADRAKRNGDGT